MEARYRGRMIFATAAALLLMFAFCFLPAPAPAQAQTTTGSQKVAVFENARVAAGEVWDNVVVVGGDLVVEGSVTNVIVIVGGNLTLAGTAQVGTGVASGDAAIVSVFGDVQVEPGAGVGGRTIDVGGAFPSLALGQVSDPILRPWRLGAILNWIWSTIFLAVAAAVASAIAPRQVAVVSERVRRHFFSSLGWGALGVIVGVPIVTVILIVSIIGLLVVVPWLVIGLPLLSLFGLVAVGAMVGRLLLGRQGLVTREDMVLAAVIGVVIINLARWIPIAGAIILGLLWLVGFGATYVAIYVWLRDRRRRRRLQPAGPPNGHLGSGGPPPGYPGAPPSAAPPGYHGASPAPPPPVPPAGPPPGRYQGE